MQRILLRSGKSPFDVVTPETVLQRRVGGANLGNLMFSDSAHRMLLTGDTEVTPTRFDTKPEYAERINEEYDALVLPFANAFRPSFAGSLESWTQLIEQLRIPVVVLGIGAQSTLDYDLEPLRPIEDTVRRFVRAVLERSPAIGVRGEFTEYYLNSLGFADVEVIGCPSMFRNGADLHVGKWAQALDATSRIAVSVTRSDVGPIEDIVLANYERYPETLYVAQDLSEVEVLYWGDTSEAAGRHAALPQYRTHPLFRDNRVRAFADPLTWIDELAGHDFAFGTRIHGNIAALLGGTPAMVLCHDSRTLELSRYFDIPHRRLGGLAPDTDAADLYAEADYSALVNGHKERFERMVGFLDRCGLDHVFRDGGDGGASFDARLGELELAPGIEVWDGTDDGGLGYRMSWLKENVTRLKKRDAQLAKTERRVTELSAQVKALTKRVETLERAHRNTPYRRVRRAIGRRLRRG